MTNHFRQRVRVAFMFVMFFVALVAAAGVAALRAEDTSDLRQSLLFHASFDGQADADLAKGDPKIYTAFSFDRKDPKAGLAADSVRIAPGAGRFGDALWFDKDPGQRALFFRAEGNMGYRSRDWSGTVSFWLRLDPERDLAPGYCDPIQITERAWNDAAFFVDFTKDDLPRHFRLGTFADYAVWNPKNREWEKIPPAERPLVEVVRPPFRHDQWTHVAFTFSGINRGRDDAVARLYLNGQLQGAIEHHPQVFTWDPKKAGIMLGLAYVGGYDDLAIFDRALREEEIQAIYRLEGGVRSLGR